jgi:Mn-dependent DtxR family transcriptional regulator
MAYQITPRQRANAKRLGVTLKSSSNRLKKLDVFKNGKKVTSIGARGYKDYDIYLRTKGKKFADERRRLYKIRHQSNRTKRNTTGYYADQILW